VVLCVQFVCVAVTRSIRSYDDHCHCLRDNLGESSLLSLSARRRTVGPNCCFVAFSSSVLFECVSPQLSVTFPGELSTEVRSLICCPFKTPIFQKKCAPRNKTNWQKQARGFVISATKSRADCFLFLCAFLVSE